MIRTTIFDLDMTSSKPLIISVKSNTIYIPFTIDSIITLTYVVKGTDVNAVYGLECNRRNIKLVPISTIPNNWYGDIIRSKWLCGHLYSHLDYFLIIQQNLIEEERKLKKMDKYLSIQEI
jgi:hypothetical protein